MARWRRFGVRGPQLGEAVRNADNVRIQPIGGHRWHPKDIYHQLLRLSWSWLTLIFVASFVVFNLLFAIAFSFDLGGVEWGAQPVQGPPLLRAFFFSVDTVGTIGYGNMYPVSLYANLLVVIEITFGILFFAIVTGIVFARFSRPTARILFSKVAVVSDVGGTPTLMFRAANLRHNLVFEARVTVSLLIDDMVGGTPMRRFRTLKLERDSNPVFTLSWMVMHPIDEDSPLASCVKDGKLPQNAEIIVILSGFDDRTGQMIHGRWAYDSEDVRWKVKFADIIGKSDDGTRTIDYRRFHDIADESGVDLGEKS